MVDVPAGVGFGQAGDGAGQAGGVPGVGEDVESAVGDFGGGGDTADQPVRKSGVP